MDEVSFELAPAGGDFDDELTQVKIDVNGTSLPELVREIELPYTRAEGQEELAGTYVGLVPGYIRMDLAGQFLGGSGAWLYPHGEGKTALLSCDCGEVGCSPLLARITLDDDTVTWDEFEQPERPEWDYAALGPFTFNRRQYEAALFAVLD